MRVVRTGGSVQILDSSCGARFFQHVGVGGAVGNVVCCASVLCQVLGEAHVHVVHAGLGREAERVYLSVQQCAD